MIRLQFSINQPVGTRLRSRPKPGRDRLTLIHKVPSRHSPRPKEERQRILNHKRTQRKWIIPSSFLCALCDLCGLNSLSFSFCLRLGLAGICGVKIFVVSCPHPSWRVLDLSAFGFPAGFKDLAIWVAYKSQVNARGYRKIRNLLL